MIERLLQAFRNLTTGQQALAIAIPTLLLLVVVAGGVGGFVSSWKDARFDKQEAERETQREALEDERNQAIGRATAAEAKAKELESQTRILEVTIEAQGARAQQAREAVENEAEKLDKEISDIGVDVEPCERVRRLCARLKAQNIYPKDKQCDCQ